MLNCCCCLFWRESCWWRVEAGEPGDYCVCYVQSDAGRRAAAAARALLRPGPGPPAAQVAGHGGAVDTALV